MAPGMANQISGVVCATQGPPGHTPGNYTQLVHCWCKFKPKQSKTLQSHKQLYVRYIFISISEHETRPFKEIHRGMKMVGEYFLYRNT